MGEVGGCHLFESTGVVGGKFIIDVEPAVDLLVCELAYCFPGYLTSIVWLWGKYGDEIIIDNDSTLCTDKGVEMVKAHR